MSHRVPDVLHDWWERGAFPGAAVARVGPVGVETWTIGRHTDDPGSPRVDEATRYDLASLTKVMVTTPVIADLVADGRIALSSELSAFLPELPWPGVTVADALRHTGGLPAYFDDPSSLASADDVWRQMRSRPERAPGIEVCYSCRGFIALWELARRVTGRSSHELAESAAVEGTMLPGPNGVAPTQQTTHAGITHDPASRALGGFGGNAGWFASVAEVAAFAQSVLRGRFNSAWTSAGPGGRGLAWDIADSDPDVRAAGPSASAATFGHLGYTGTSLWVNPEREVAAVILSNRVHPDDSEERAALWREARRAINEAVFAGG